MKISGKFIAKVAGTLTVISLVVAALLGLVNSVTADKIDAINEENTKIALSAVTEEGSTFEPVEVSEAVSAAASVQGGTIEEMYTVTTNGAAAGYAIKLTALRATSRWWWAWMLPVPSPAFPSSPTPRLPASAPRS